MASAPATSLENALKQRVLLLNISPVNPAWSALPDEVWEGAGFARSANLNLTRPDMVVQWSRELLNAGADILETPCLFADALSAAELYGADRSLRRQWNEAAVAIARQAADGQKFIAGAVGPGTDFLTFQHRHSFEEHVAGYAEQIRDLCTAGVDVIHLAFHLDSQNLKAALHAVAAIEGELSCRVPTMITLDVEPAGTLISGERPEALVRGILRDYRPIALGLVTYGRWQDAVRRLRDVTDVPLGLLLDPCPWAPPEMTENQPIEWLGECLGPLLDERLLSFCGLSCTVPSIEYVKAVAGLIQGRPGPGRV